MTALPYFDPNAAELSSTGFDVNNAGVVVGFGGFEVQSDRGVKWEANGAVSQWPTNASTPFSRTVSVTADGQVAVGSAWSADFLTLRAVVWHPTFGMVNLPDYAAHGTEFGYSDADVISDDGSTAWGSSTFDPESFATTLVRWKTNGASITVEDIGTLPGGEGFNHYIGDTSANGNVAVGSAHDRFSSSRAIVIVGTEIIPLPRLPRGNNGFASGTNSNGTVVVGDDIVGDQRIAFIWRGGSTVEALPQLNAQTTWSNAIGISDNGVIVGYAAAGANDEAILWIGERPIKLRDYLVDQYGASLAGFTRIEAILAISRDGRQLTGVGKHGGNDRAFHVTFAGNRPPMANAGTDVRKNNAGPSGVNVKLDGRKSADPDGESLSFRWSGARFDSKTAARPTAKFPVGTTTVTLRAADIARASSTDTVRIIVKAKRSKIRPEGLAANEAFANAATLTAAANGSAEANEAALVGAENAALADALGAALGDAYVWGEDESPEAAAADYGAWRLLQSAYGQAAIASLAQAYLETGDAAYAEAYRSATNGTQRALADLAE